MSTADPLAPADHIAWSIVRTALKGQYHASLRPLHTAIARCPDDLWISRAGGHANPYWHIAYHVLFYTHLYLQPDEASFRPWALHRDEYNFLGTLPWPPHRPPKIGQPYTKAAMLEYHPLVEAMVDPAVDKLDLASPQCGFWWYKIGKLEHQINNIRHIQHHAAQLADRLRAACGIGIEWS